MTQKKFEFIDHTADVGIRVYAKTVEELFVNAALGMYNIICEKFYNILDEKVYTNELKEVDIETLLVSFLNDLLYQTFVNKLLFCKFEIKNLIKEKEFCQLRYICKGQIYNHVSHGTLFELKAATFHNIKIEKFNNEYTTTIIFDT